MIEDYIIVACGYVHEIVEAFFNRESASDVAGDVAQLRLKLAMLVFASYHASGQHLFLHFTYFNKAVLGASARMQIMPCLLFYLGTVAVVACRHDVGHFICSSVVPAADLPPLGRDH